ncbi:MAG: hypothetical protein OSB55_10335 [Verrucomicrobiota bacterium]|nr:hypothetical protein [Nitrospinaceae bacterium]MDE2643136.1 hypothetical protein [Verrucomicrobiota bacterium]
MTKKRKCFGGEHWQKPAALQARRLTRYFSVIVKKLAGRDKESGAPKRLEAAEKPSSTFALIHLNDLTTTS